VLRDIGVRVTENRYTLDRTAWEESVPLAEAPCGIIAGNSESEWVRGYGKTIQGGWQRGKRGETSAEENV